MDPELLNYISKYKNIKWEILSKKELSEFSLVAAEPNLLKIKSIFDKIINYQEIYSRKNQWSDILKNQIREFLNFIQTISEYSDTKERDSFINLIKDKEYQVIMALKDLLSIVDYNSNGEDKILERLNLKIHDTIVLEVEDKIKKEFDNDKMTELLRISDDLISNKSKILEATSLIESMNKQKEIAQNKTLEGRALSFAEKANEHNKKYIYLWLIASSFIGSITYFIIKSFIKDLGSNNNVSIGFALMRISSLVIPSFFAVFCIQQYLNHKKLYEGYRYRDIALMTMKDLLMERGKEDEQKEILNKGLSVIFSEPTVKDDNIQKEVMGILKEIVIKNTK